MRWSTLGSGAPVSAIAEADGTLFVLDAATSTVTTLSAVTGLAGRVLDWDRALALTAYQGTLFVADSHARVWGADVADPDASAAWMVATGLGAVRAMSFDDMGTLYALVGPTRGAAPAPLVSRDRGVNVRRPVVAGGTQLRPSGRTTLIRLDVESGTATTVARMGAAEGLAVSSDGARAYITTRAGGLVTVDTTSGTVIAARTPTARPGVCAWVDRDTVLAIAEPDHDRIALVDVATGDCRSIRKAPLGVSAVVSSSTALFVGSADGLWAMDRAEADLHRVHLHEPPTALPRGGYGRVLVDVGLSGIDPAALELAVENGPEYGMFSASVEHPPHPESAVLIAGPHTGRYTINARHGTGGPIVASGEFEIVDRWDAADGPSQAFTGRCEVFTTGAAGWGSMWNGLLPWSFTFGPAPISGTQRVAIILADPLGLIRPASTETTYRDAFTDGVPWQGTTASSAAYFAELSGGTLSFTLAGVAQVMLNRPWRDYFTATQHPSSGDDIFRFKRELIADAVWEAGTQLDLSAVDTIVVVVASPSGGQPTPLPPPFTGTVANFAWPYASGGTFMWGRWGPFPTIHQWSWKAFRFVVMPAEWNTIKGSATRVLGTLTHELGHTIGMPDLYMTPVRDVDDLDVMSDSTNLPALCLPHRVGLGWTPRSQLKRYNFLTSGSADEDVTITAAELTAAGPRPGEFGGIEIEIEDGRRYYFEYRSEQSLAPPDTGPLQIADRVLGGRNERVIGYDVMAGSYTPPITRGPVILLVQDDDDVQAGVYADGEDYEEFDAGANSRFRLNVVSTTDESAVVHVRYGPPPVPTPALDGPDPSLRPWPGNGVWVSPDLTITNPMVAAFGFPAIQNGVTNTIVATVHNDTDRLARGVTVGFWVKDFAVSAGGVEQLLGYSGAQDVAANSTATFTMAWPVPNAMPLGLSGMPYTTHVCLVARITPLTGPGGALLERSANNNEAQTNITLAFSSFASPGTRTRIPVAVTNPFDDRDVTAYLHVDQSLDGWRTYVEHLHVHLAPAETRSVEVMTECLYDQPGHPDLPDELLQTPNILAAVSYVLESGDAPEVLGGATIEVRPGRAITITDLDVSRSNANGRVLDVGTGTSVNGGRVLVSTRSAEGIENSFIDSVTAHGTFDVATPGLAGLAGPVDVTLIYSDGGSNVCEVRIAVA
jgi:M6 family metalloprotease-like protein